MASAEQQDSSSSKHEVALIVGGGPGISASCARLFAQSGMAVAIAARNPDKPVLRSLAQSVISHRRGGRHRGVDPSLSGSLGASHAGHRDSALAEVAGLG
jgi:NAD(P)-dependent dehydrogenase (short-subunit alcohol dehydrogenase family)